MREPVGLQRSRGAAVNEILLACYEISASCLPGAIAAAVFLGRFFLFDEMGAASMLYGF